MIKLVGFLACLALLGCQPKSVEDSWQPPKIYFRSSESRLEMATKRQQLSDQDTILFLDSQGQNTGVDRLQVTTDCGGFTRTSRLIRNPISLLIQDILPDQIYFDASSKTSDEVMCTVEFVLMNSLGSTDRTHLPNRKINLNASQKRKPDLAVNGLPITAGTTYSEDDFKRARIHLHGGSGELRLLCSSFATQLAGPITDNSLPELLRADITGAEKENDPRNLESRHKCQLVAQSDKGEKFFSETFQLVFNGPPLKAKLLFVSEDLQANPSLKYDLKLNNENAFAVSVSMEQPRFACARAHLEFKIEQPTSSSSSASDSKLVREEIIEGKPYLLITVPPRDSQTIQIKLVQDEARWLSPECAAAGAWPMEIMTCRDLNFNRWILGSWKPELRFAKSGVDIRTGKFEHHPSARLPLANNAPQVTCSQ